MIEVDVNAGKKGAEYYYCKRLAIVNETVLFYNNCDEVIRKITLYPNDVMSIKESE